MEHFSCGLEKYSLERHIGDGGDLLGDGSDLLSEGGNFLGDGGNLLVGVEQDFDILQEFLIAGVQLG